MLVEEESPHSCPGSTMMALETLWRQVLVRVLMVMLVEMVTVVEVVTVQEEDHLDLTVQEVGFLSSLEFKYMNSL